MIKINELRIGNYISREDIGDMSIRFETVLEFHQNKVVTSGPIKVVLDYGDLKPIQLTEEILLKCGYIKDEFDNWENETRLGLYKPDEFDGYLSIWGESTVGECNYLHQLQNLYFALTGEELEVNL